MAYEMRRAKGTLLIRDLINSKEVVDFALSGDNGQEHIGSQCDTVYINDMGGSDGSAIEKYQVTLNIDSEMSFMTKDLYTGKIDEIVCPTYIILGHELVHAYRRINGMENVSREAPYKSYEYNETGQIIFTYPKDRIEELETVGITYTDPLTGRYVKGSKFRYTENILRTENGIGLRIRY